jgi:DNA (cytosine-5)-methyltransferase 1
LGGVHRGRDDHRNLFPVLLDVIRTVHPKVVLVENVPGLVRPSFRPFFDYVLDQLRLPSLEVRDEDWTAHQSRLSRSLRAGQADYLVDWRMLDAADFGVPQRRRRVFIQAVRTDIGDSCQWPDTTHSSHLLRVALSSGAYQMEHGLAMRTSMPAAEVLPFEGPGQPHERWRTVRDAIRSLPPADESGEFQTEVTDHVSISLPKP